MGFFDWFRRKRDATPPPSPTSPFDPNFVPPKPQHALLLTAEAAVGLTRDPRPLLYLFQHYELRDAAFQNHPKLIRELGSETPSFRPLMHFIIKARIRNEQVGALEPLPSDDNGAAAEAELDEFRSVKIDRNTHGAFSAYIVHMPAPIAAGEAHFTAIVFRTDELHENGRESPSTRYFTFEKTFFSDVPLLCEWTRGNEHLNYGPGPGRTPEAFLSAVVEKIGS